MSSDVEIRMSKRLPFLYIISYIYGYMKSRNIVVNYELIEITIYILL